MAAAAAAAPGGDTERDQPDQPDQPGLEAAEQSMFVHKDVSSTKIYVLQPWIVSLLEKDDQLGEHENLLAGQVVRVLSGSAAPGRPGVLRSASLQVTDGSHYIRVVVSPEALQGEENAYMQPKLAGLTCRIIVLQKYTVCFQEEARLEDCEFYLTAQQFIVLPIQRQRIESSDGNQEPSVVKKIKELWLRNPAVKNAPSSDPSISQLIDAIGQNQLDILKENAEECLDLRMPKEKPVTVTDEVPVTEWEAERKKEGQDVFMVPADTLVIPPEEEEVACDSSKTDTNKTTSGKSSDDRTVPGDPSVVSQASHAESLALSDSLEGSLDNPWNRVPPLSLTPSSSDEKTFQPDASLKTQKDVSADSNTPDLLELCSQDSPKRLPQGEPVQTFSPSLLCSYSSPSPVKTSTSQAASALGAACGAPCAAQGLQGSRGSQAPLPTLSPDFPVLPSTSLQSMPDRMPHGEQACSSGTAFPPDALKPCPVPARTQNRAAAGAKRKLMVGDDQALLAPGEQQHPQGTPRGRGTGTGRRSELMSPRGAKKSRKETGLQHGKELEEEEEEEEEEEQASSSASGPSSRPEQRRTLEPYVRKPAQYKYEAPSPELCQQIQSIRISKAMLKWACWILTEEEEEDS
ncbi:uncharacterized protein LOC113948733 isoform X2 [Corapipo altera]|uniref:uncharacterized protein LOC113948733 isoform X2 n=1 Tax=Corapipo altera TaxID=415028 RepID=UPI000FD6AFD8|nr:uncharacterized protein LOC113948733 isoform X2 [Corapipo altera]